MTRVSLRVALLGAGLWLCQCGDNSNSKSDDNGPYDASQDVGVVSDGGARADGGCTARCTGTRDYDAQSYSLRAKFDWNAQRLFADEEIVVRLTKPGQSVVALDAAVDVKRVSLDGRALPWVLDADRHVLHVDLGPRDGDTRTFVVTYEAAVSDALMAPPAAENGDPVTSRAMFTIAEPDLARKWLVCNDHPPDRALWAVELTVAADEDVIANGERVRDERKGGERAVGYRIDMPLPTYLMAFAMGQLEHRDRAGWRVPLSVWYRRGLKFDVEAHLDLLVELMGTYDRLIGPYPFSRYSVVVLPEFPGGMEYATITAIDEESALGNTDFELNAHELAHQWFGDWVTMHDYDDVWVKEGTATLLAAEAERKYRDGEGKQRLFGSDFPFSAEDAIVDKSLTGQDKYTSGPYGRAAWTLTKIRAHIGEDAFWKSLRGVLKAHALGSIDGESFVRAFAPALDEASVQKILATLETKMSAPEVAVEVPDVAAGADAQVKFTLSDPSAELLDPFEITVIDKDGVAQPVQKLVPGVPLIVTVPAGGYFAYDERDIHPSWDGVPFSVKEYHKGLIPLMAPRTPGARAAFGVRSAATQERILFPDEEVHALFAPGELGSLYASLDSRNAKFGLATSACRWLGEVIHGGGDPAPWANALEPILKQPTYVTSDYYAIFLPNLGPTYPLPWFGSELSAPVTAENAARQEYLLEFDYGPQQSLDYAARLVAQGSSKMRSRAIDRLALQAWGGPGSRYSAVTAEAAPAWKEFFRARLAETTTALRLLDVWTGIVALSDDRALTLLGPRLHSIPLDSSRQREVVCDANRIAQARPEAWEEFRNSAKPWETLDPGVLEVLQDPSKCEPRPPAVLAKARRH